MFLIIGLGNPGQQYQQMRHNAGFMALDYFKEKQNFPDFIFIKSFNSLISEGKIGKKKIILAKPQTFMNNSGQVAKYLIKNLKLKIQNLLVIHDDADIKLGEVKIVKNRGSARHKGVESIIQEIGTKNFLRMRIGINPAGREGEKNKKTTEGFVLKDFVLKNFSRDEKNVLKEVFKKILDGLFLLFVKGLSGAMNKINKKSTR